MSTPLPGSQVKTPLRVAVVGAGARGALAHSVVAGFSALGHAPTLVPYMDWAPRPKLKFRGAGVLTRGLASATRPALEVRLIVELTRLRPDLVLFLKCDDLHRTFYRGLRRALPSARLVGYHPDDPWNQGRGLNRGPAHPRALMQLAEVDMAFTWSRELVAKIQREVRPDGVHYLAFACDPALHPRVSDVTDAERAALASPVCFIGNWDEERERWLGPLADAGLGLAIWGTDYWRTRCKHPGVRAAYRGRPLVGREQAVAAGSSDILVNVLRRQNKGACNMRTFEIPCVGAFMLHERSDEAAAFFPPGLACGDFATPEELVAACRHYLAHPDERQRLAAEGHRRALAWTYREWCQTLVSGTHT